MPRHRPPNLRRVLVLAAVATAAGCASTIPDPRLRTPEAVVGKTWQWAGMTTPMERFSVPDPDRYTLTLAPDGRAAMRADCNRGTARYEIADGKIGFGPIAATHAACPPGSLDTRYLRELGRVTTFFLMEGVLYLELPGKTGTLTFTVK